MKLSPTQPHNDKLTQKIYHERRSEKIEHKMEEWENAQLIYLEITTFHEELHGGFQSNGQGYSRNKEDLI